MKIQRIYAENYKTYRRLDLNLEVDNERPIKEDKSKSPYLIWK